MALMARAYNQAQKFGAELAIPDEAVAVDGDRADGERRFRLRLGPDEAATARSVVVASGAATAVRRSRRSRISRARASITGPRRSNASSAPARRSCWSAAAIRRDRRRSISPSQAAKVWMLRPRRSSWTQSMSRYLIDRIARPAAISSWSRRRKSSGSKARHGNLHASSRWQNRPDGRRDAARNPPLSSCSSAPIRTPTGCRPPASTARRQRLHRAPAACGHGRHPLETSMSRACSPSATCASGSVKRVAAAVGEGAQVVAAIHTCLAAEARAHPLPPPAGASSRWTDDCSHTATIARGRRRAPKAARNA